MSETTPSLILKPPLFFNSDVKPNTVTSFHLFVCWLFHITYIDSYYSGARNCVQYKQPYNSALCSWGFLSRGKGKINAIQIGTSLVVL